MKKIITLIMSAAMVLSFAACGTGSAGAGTKPGDTMSLKEVMDATLKDVENLPATDNIEITDENFESYLFIKPIKGAEALASESMISAVAHSVVLLRLPEGEDAAAVAETIKKNANPRKWVCVEAEETIVSAHGNTILLVMSFKDTATPITANFDNLWA
ncbi:MAG: hypothetical protein RR147_04710 [Oscillospiraceae bacterium]